MRRGGTERGGVEEGAGGHARHRVARHDGDEPGAAGGHPRAGKEGGSYRRRAARLDGEGGKGAAAAGRRDAHRLRQRVGGHKLGVGKRRTNDEAVDYRDGNWRGPAAAAPPPTPVRATDTTATATGIATAIVTATATATVDIPSTLGALHQRRRRKRPAEGGGQERR